MANGKFVSYYRVSTQQQGRSGLGLEAQELAVGNHLNGGNWELIASFTEIESGKDHTNRPKLLEALALCRKHKATLIIAKLDRLSRNVAFISNLMESNIEFIACDFPTANRLTLHILAAVAEHEREMISKRTVEALAASKSRGRKLGWSIPSRTDGEAARAKGRAYRQAKANQYASNIQPIINQIQASGVTTLVGVAGALNARGIKSPRGGQWYASTVRNQIKRSA